MRHGPYFLFPRACLFSRGRRQPPRRRSVTIYHDEYYESCWHTAFDIDWRADYLGIRILRLTEESRYAAICAIFAYGGRSAAALGRESYARGLGL